MSIILRISVYDHPGVVDRITGIIRRNGWNISGINAGEMSGEVSRVNILLRQRDVDIRLIDRHLTALDCVRDWEVCTEQTHFVRELFAFTVRETDFPGEQTLPGARILERQDDLLFVEFTGSPVEVDSFLKSYEGRLLDFVRTGVVSIARGGERA